MQSLHDHDHTTPGTLTTAMPLESFRSTLGRALDALPQAIGVSNHTGSLLTARRGAMISLMAEVHSRGLFFLDGRTTADTVAREVAAESGVPALRRDVFLDNHLDALAISSEFERAIEIARRQGHAVLIAHPHDLSLELLETLLPTLTARGVAQIPLTQLFERVSETSAPPGPRQGPASLRTAPAL
jgi:polysaccharide deacetylase 2 family uncharacterized protein YibQ